jgi:hypothetical protein
MKNLKIIGLYLLIIIFPFVGAGLYVSKRSNNKWKGIFIAVIAGLLMFAAVGEETKPDSGATQIFELSKELEEKEAKILELEQKPEATKEAVKEIKESVKPTKKEYTFSSGNYIAGEDFPAGRYDIIAVKGNGNVYSDNSFDGGINAVMGVGDEEFYEKEYKNITLKNKIGLHVSGVTIKLVYKGD